MGTFYQSPTTKPIAVVLAAACACIYLAGMAAFVRVIHTGDFVVDTIVTGFGAGGFVWVVFRMTRLGVLATDKGITIRGWRRTDFIDWNRIERFSSGSDIAVGDLTLRELVVNPALHSYVVLTDGRHRVLPGLSASRLHRTASTAEVGELLGQLDALRRSQMHRRSPDDGG